jgi:uncharacterized protein
MQDRKKLVSINKWLQLIIFLVVYVVLFFAIGFILPATSGDFINSILVGITASSLLSILLVFLFSRVIFKNDQTPLGLNVNQQLRRSISGAFLGVFLIMSGSMILYAGGWLEWTDSNANAMNIILLSLLLLLSAFAEELVFRGYILGRLLNETNRAVALLASSAVFAVFHINNPEVSFIAGFNIFLGGMLLGITYSYSRNIWFGFMLHFTWNLVQGPILGIPVSGLILPSIVSSEINGPELLTGGQFGLEASLVQGILLAISCVGLWTLNASENKTVCTAKKI